MKDKPRRCAKCGASSAKDPTLGLHRFQRPTADNNHRTTAWAMFCYPEENWNSVEFHMKLWKNHKMLCTKHFPTTAFLDVGGKKKLHRYAVPSEPITAVVQNPQPTEPGTSTSLDVALDSCVLTSKTDEATAQLHHSQPGTSKIPMIIEKNVRSVKEKHLYNKCRRQFRQICSLQKRMRNLRNQQILETLQDEEAVKGLSCNLTSSFAVLLQGQLMNCKRKKKAYRWTLPQKIIALRLYKRSPACYRLLRRLFNLPSQSTLKNLLNKLPLKPGINKHLFDAIRKIADANINKQHNEYTLAFDEMSIRKNLNYNKKIDEIDGFQDHGEENGRDKNIASHALVFMIVGIRKKVKQPVAYYLSGDHVTADRLTALIKEVLQACFEAGISIAATVCDMDGVNRGALSKLGASVDKPYFDFGGNEIITLHDTPHLLKCFRNLLLKYDLNSNCNVECNGEPVSSIAKWSHIQKFYELDNNNPFFVFAPALRNYHINPNSKQKMKVKLAAQVLSHTVSAGMYAKVALGELPTEALGTINVINKIDKLFDSLNADSPGLKRGKKYSRNISDRSPHFEYFKEMKDFFKNCSFIGAKSRPPSLDGWIKTMSGVERLWNSLKKKYPDIGSLSTRRLQQDALENCFGCIRGNCGSNSNPTASQFVAALKTGIISNLSSPNTSANCEADESSIMENLNVFLKNNESESQPTHPAGTINEVDSCSSITDEINMDENTGEIQACAYVCGFIIKRFVNLDCEMCVKTFTSSSESVCHIYTMFKEYSNKKSLQYANVEMVKCVEESASRIYDFLNNYAHLKKVKENIKKILQKSFVFKFLDACEEHKDENIRNVQNAIFHICIKRYCTNKNKEFAEKAAESSLKRKLNILKHC